MATRTIEFTSEELKFIGEMLKGDLARLSMEISHTDHREYRDYLKNKQLALEEVDKKIG